MAVLADRWLCHAVTVERPVTDIDVYGNAAEVSVVATALSVRLQQDQRAEKRSASAVDGRIVETGGWTLFAGAEADVRRGDRVVWPGHPSGTLTFEVVGPPEPTYRHTGELDHWEMSLLEVHG